MGWHGLSQWAPGPRERGQREAHAADGGRAHNRVGWVSTSRCPHLNHLFVCVCMCVCVCVCVCIVHKSSTSTSANTCTQPQPNFFIALLAAELIKRCSSCAGSQLKNLQTQRTCARTRKECSPRCVKWHCVKYFLFCVYNISVGCIDPCVSGYASATMRVNILSHHCSSSFDEQMTAPLFHACPPTYLSASAST